MLNLPIAMLKLPVIFALFFWMQSTTVAITSPQPGDNLRGQVEILGTMDVPNFASAELAFSYDAPSPAESWFTIQTFPQPVQNPTLAVWDTTTVTDGDYTLRLRVFLTDGSSQDVVVSGLKIRNDEPLTTATPTSTAQADIQLFETAAPPTLTPRPQPTLQTFPSPTPLPPNPASVTSSSIYVNFGRGALIVLVLFIFVGIIFRFRSRA